jgi:hypothetical protein
LPGRLIHLDGKKPECSTGALRFLRARTTPFAGADMQSEAVQHGHLGVVEVGQSQYDPTIVQFGFSLSHAGGLHSAAWDYVKASIQATDM